MRQNHKTKARLGELEQAAGLLGKNISRQLMLLKLSTGMDSLTAEQKKQSSSFAGAMNAVEGIPVIRIVWQKHIIITVTTICFWKPMIMTVFIRGCKQRLPRVILKYRFSSVRRKFPNSASVSPVT